MAGPRSNRPLKLIDAPEPFSPGTALGSCVLGNLIGRGSWCRVYQATQDAQRRLVAVKVLADTESSSQTSHLPQKTTARRSRSAEAVSLGLSLLRREAEVGRAVMDTRLVAVWEAHLDEPPYFLVLEWVDGTSLQQLLALRGRLPPPLALRLARHVARALQALDEAGYVHGDVKPENILVSRQWQAKLGDLGLAKQVRHIPIAEAPRPGTARRSAAHTDWAASPIPRPHALSTPSGAFWGTANYMAPELTTTYHTGDIRSDIYSLGITLYQMLVGVRPFPDRDFFATLTDQRQSVPEPARWQGVSLPPSLIALLDRLLAKDPLRRPQTSEELVDLLRRQEIETFDLGCSK